MIIKLKNDFHGTECNVNAKLAANGKYYVSERVYKRAKTALCGAKGCQCGAPNGLMLIPGRDYAEVED